VSGLPRRLAPPGDEVSWTLHSPPLSSCPGGEAPWLAELRSFRARVLHDGGRRPSFRAVDGRYWDPDPVDLHASHVVARWGDSVIGAVRLLPLVAPQPGTVERLIGAERLETLITGLGADRAHAAEGGGWVVDPDFRGSAVGSRLVAAAVALTWHLGARLMVAALGTRYGQDRIVGRLGMRAVPGLDTLPLPGYADDVRLCYLTPEEGGPAFQDSAADMAARLGLAEVR
jgi:GNAT superfamily N-acetyltransferase